MRISRILCIYIGRHFLTALLGSLAAVMGLIYLFDTIELLRRSASYEGVGFGAVLTLALFKLPQMMERVLPFAVMIAAMVCFVRLTRSRELVVTRSAGVSVWQILAPVIGVVLVLGVLDVIGFNHLAASLYQRYEQLQDQVLLRNPMDSPMQVGEAGLWLREAQGDEFVIVHANSVRQEKFDLKLREVSLFVTDDRERLVYRIEATLGQLRPGHLDLTDVRLMRAEHPVEFFESYQFPTELTLAKVQDNFASPETVSFWELPGFIAFFESAGFSASRQKLYFQSLLSSPLLLCSMVLLAAVFTLRPDLRSGGQMVRIVGGVVAGFVFYFFSKVVYALGLSAALPPSLAAWTPAMVAGLAGMTALLHLEDG